MRIAAEWHSPLYTDPDNQSYRPDLTEPFLHPAYFDNLIYLKANAYRLQVLIICQA